MRILRSVYNKLIRKGLAGQTYPFKNVYTGIDRLCKRAVDEQIIAGASGYKYVALTSLSLTATCFCSHSTRADVVRGYGLSET